MKTTIYYFSGTGNSLQAARDLAQRLGGASIQAITKNTEADSSAEAVGIVFPVYLLGVPDMVLQFAEKLGRSSAARYYFAIATYKAKAGEPIGQMKREMARHGITLSAGFTIRMPGNNDCGSDPCRRGIAARRGVRPGTVSENRPPAFGAGRKF